MATTFEQDVQAFYDEGVRVAADGLTTAEAGLMVGRFISLCVRSAFRLGNPGPEKKAIVMQWVSNLIDKVIPALPWPWSWLAWAGKRAILNYIDGQIESEYETQKAALRIGG